MYGKIFKNLEYEEMNEDQLDQECEALRVLNFLIYNPEMECKDCELELECPIARLF